MHVHVFACNSFVIPSWGTRKRLYGGGLTVYGLCCCRAVSAAVRPLCAVGLSGSCQAVTLGPDSDGTPLMSGSAVRLSDTCCQTVRESAVSAVRLSGTVRRCPGFAVRLSDQGSARARPCEMRAARLASRGPAPPRVPSPRTHLGTLFRGLAGALLQETSRERACDSTRQVLEGFC